MGSLIPSVQGNTAETQDPERKMRTLRDKTDDDVNAERLEESDREGELRWVEEGSGERLCLRSGNGLCGLGTDEDKVSGESRSRL